MKTKTSQDDIKLKDEILKEYLNSDMSADALILRTISKTRADGLSFVKETSRKENRDLWDSLRECEKELKDTRHLALKEVFAELDKEDCGDKSYEEPALMIGYHTYRNIKKKFGVKLWRKK